MLVVRAIGRGSRTRVIRQLSVAGCQWSVKNQSHDSRKMALGIGVAAAASWDKGPTFANSSKYGPRDERATGHLNKGKTDACREPPDIPFYRTRPMRFH